MDKKAIERQIQALSVELARLENQPKDEFECGTVITFTKYFKEDYRRTPSGGGSDGYTYAAVKTKAGWSLTGYKQRNPMDWNQLYDFIGQYETTVPEIWVVFEWEQLA